MEVSGCYENDIWCVSICMWDNVTRLVRVGWELIELVGTWNFVSVCECDCWCDSWCSYQWVCVVSLVLWVDVSWIVKTAATEAATGLG